MLFYTLKFGEKILARRTLCPLNYSDHCRLQNRHCASSDTEPTVYLIAPLLSLKSYSEAKMGRKLKSIEDYERAIKQGYGVGTGKSYKPWLRVKDVPSRGRSTKYESLTVGRIHHTLSDWETRILCLADFDGAVVDIREQFPLLPLTTVSTLAENLGIRYPTIPGTSTPIIMTTDFLLTIETDSGVSYLAIAVKEGSELNKNRSREKLDIERVFWQSIGVEWILATDIEISKTVSDNLVWINSILKGNTAKYMSLSSSALLDISSRISTRIYSIEALLMLIMDCLELGTDDAKYILCKAIWEHVLIVDLHQSIQTTGLIRVLGWSSNTEGKCHGFLS